MVIHPRMRDTARSSPRHLPSLLFSTYLGGSTPCESCDNATTFAQNTASDAYGNTYVTGATQVWDLPALLNAWQPGPSPGQHHVGFPGEEYDPAGRLLWCTYLGGNRAKPSASGLPPCRTAVSP